MDNAVLKQAAQEALDFLTDFDFSLEEDCESLTCAECKQWRPMRRAMHSLKYALRINDVDR
jgi:hypothetical protein